MAATLSAKFSAIDEISSVFEKMASFGARAVDQWDSASVTASNAFEQASTGANSAAKAMQTAASQTDQWTSAIGNYDKSAMEAVYTTEELVEMGYKTEEALSAEARAAAESTSALEKSISVTQEFRNTNAELESELEQLQDAYIGTAVQYGKNSEEAKKLQKEIGELSKIVDKNKQEFNDLEKSSGKAGDTTADSVQAIQSALVAAGIAKLVSDITSAVIEMANEFSNASAVVAKATGATGSQLDSLNKSMMNVYATVKTGDLSSVAGAVGEINTRLGLQGDELDNVTKLFMDYSQITGKDVVGSVQSVTKVMKNWGVDVKNTEGLLDQLAAAGQMSGASVDQLSDMVVQNKATLQQLGYGLEDSIALLAMFEYEGLNASSIMMGFRSAVTDFSKDGKDASEAMQEVIEQIGSMASEADATALAIETFGSRAGAEMAFAIRNGKFEIQEWIAAVGGADRTLSKTADAATTLEEKWQKASNNVNTAFSKTLTPSINNVSSTFAKMVDGIGNILNKSPVLTAVITGIGVALGIAAAALSGFIALMAIKMALMPLLTGQVLIFGVTLQAAIWPITLIALGIAALTTGLILLFKHLDESNKEFNSLTGTSKQQYLVLQDLNSEYRRTVEVQGENSAEAQRLASEIEKEQAAFEATKYTMEEFTAECDRLHESHRKLIDTYNENVASIKDEEKGASGLIAKLAELSSKTALTATEQRQLTSIIDALNKKLPGLAISYDDATGSLNQSTKAMQEFAKAQYEAQKIQEQTENYSKALEDQARLTEQLSIAEEQLAAERKVHGYEYDDVYNYYTNGTFGEDGWLAPGHKAIKKYKAEVKQLQSELDETTALIDETVASWEAAERAADEAAKAPVSYEEAVSKAVQSVTEDLEELIEKYDEAYESSLKSLDGTFKLFEKVEEKAGISSKAIIEAWQSQIDFFNKYNENLQKLQEFDLDPKFLEKLSDGSAESAGQVKALADEIGKLSPDEAAKRVKEINEKFGELSKSKETAATTMADIQTEFSTKLGEIETRMTQAIDNMTMEDDAAKAAKDTISAYIKQIKSMTSEASSAAESVARAATRALGGSIVPGISIPGYATGTLNAPDMFIAGENGPELIVGAGGSTVFPAEETNDILAAAQNTPANIEPSKGYEYTSRERIESFDKSEREVTINFAGGGTIHVDGTANEQQILDVMIEHSRPVLIGIIRQEIFEEGELSYDY